MLFLFSTATNLRGLLMLRKFEGGQCSVGEKRVSRQVWVQIPAPTHVSYLALLNCRSSAVEWGQSYILDDGDVRINEET